MVARAFVLSAAHSDQPEAVQIYGDGVRPLLAEAGATIAYRGTVAHTLAGKEMPGTVLIIEFEDADAARDFFAQPAYQALIPIREKAFATMQIHIAE